MRLTLRAARVTASIGLVMGLSSSLLSAQVRASERGTVTQTISGTEIEIDYSRPSLRERGDLFGGQIFWGEVWTPGANLATTLRVSKAVTLNGVELPAGKYSLWIEVLESEPWTLVVHEDTLRSHGNHPLVEEGLIAVQVERSESPRFIETLSFDIQDIRPTSATLEMTWGNTLVSVDLGIDLGFEIAVTPEAAAALSGDWQYDDSADVPDEETIEGWLSNADVPEETVRWTRAFFTALRELERPRTIRFEHDSETGYLSLDDPLEAEMMASVMEDGSAPAFTSVLIPRGEGMYMLASLMSGELASYNPEFARMIEFDFDGEGRAVSFVVRGWDDEVVATGVRGR